MEEKSIKFSKEQAVQIICAALQSGTITLPFGKEIHCALLEALKGKSQGINSDDIVERLIDDDLEPCACADAVYLLTFYRRLIDGI